MKKVYLIVLVILFSAITTNAQEKINIEKWKIHMDDNMQWASPAYNDNDWKPVHVNQVWDKDGYKDHLGIAWYRAKFMLPSSLKKNAYLKDSMKIFLGKIYNCDQTYLNGVLIGQNAGIKSERFDEPEYQAASMERWYKLSANNPALLWDKENVIAVRVYNPRGEGGMYEGKPYLSMIDIPDYIIINNQKLWVEMKDDNKVVCDLEITNALKSETLEGKIKAQLIQNNEKPKVMWENIMDLNIKPLETDLIEKICPLIENTSIVFTYIDNKSKKTKSAQKEIPYILTPASTKTPKINGAKVFGIRPGSPFLFTIAATGDRPMTFSAEGLPNGLTMDKNTGFIRGIVSSRGEYKVKLYAQNILGKDVRDFKIVCGDEIALTPPMGWNSWNCWGLSVSDAKVKSSTDVMVAKGLINYGWTYINIDDGWEEVHKGDSITCNEKFPNMKKLADWVHSKGLKLGIYSGPGPKTCGGYEASFNYEDADARNYGAWGIDYLKYDWCSYGSIICKGDTDLLTKPYRKMQHSLAKVKRDIVYSLCQYGMGEVWKWGASVNGNCWRTTGDITDTWESLSEIGFDQGKCSPYAKPGHWNDPDMLIVGKVGWGPHLHNTRLTPSEQYTHISLWALLSSPLLIGCDLAQLDDFTLNLLTNNEVIDIDQDALGKQATRVVKKDDHQVWLKHLEDGTIALGIFNMTESTKKITVNFSELNITGTKTIRDVWRQKDLGKFKDKFETTVFPHGVSLVKIY